MKPQLDPWTVLGVSRAATPEEAGSRRRCCRLPSFRLLGCPCSSLRGRGFPVRPACISHHPAGLQVKEQWRRLCKQHHPDLQPEHLRGPAEKYFKEISAAYRTITSRE